MNSVQGRLHDRLCAECFFQIICAPSLPSTCRRWQSPMVSDIRTGFHTCKGAVHQTPTRAAPHAPEPARRQQRPPARHPSVRRCTIDPTRNSKHDGGPVQCPESIRGESSGELYAIENLTVFAPLVLVAAIIEVSTKATVLSAQIYVAARLAHYVIYAAGIPVLRTLASSSVHAQTSLSRFRSFSPRTKPPLPMRHSLLGIFFAWHQPKSPPKHTASSDKGIVEAPPRLPLTSCHFAVMRNLVAIGAKRTSTKSRQSSIYEYTP